MTAQLPAHLQKFQSRDVGTTLSQNLGSASPPYVSIQGGRLNLIDAAGNESPVATFDPAIGVYLDACIIDVGDHISRIFYTTKFDPSAASFNPPDCWSDNGVGPSVSAAHPQSATCSACPNAVWGSAISAQGKQIPACSMVQKIALLIPAYPQTIFLLRVPPNSHKHLRAYVELCRGNGTDLSNLMTRISFDQTTQGTLLFKAASWIDEATANLRQLAWNEKKTDSLVGRNDVPRPATAKVVQQQIHGMTNGQTAQLEQHLQNPTGPVAAIGHPVQANPLQQAQQPSPFSTAHPVAATFQPQTQSTAPAPTASNPDPAPAQRRRRRTAAEMAEANGAPANAQSPQQPAAAQQAPFPHPGQQSQPQVTQAFIANAPSQAPQGSFGIAQGQPAAANPELASVLDDFFKS